MCFWYWPHMHRSKQLENNLFLGAQGLKLVQMGRLDFWVYGWSLLLPLSWRFAIFLVTSTLSSPFAIDLDDLGLEESKRNPWCFSGSICNYRSISLPNFLLEEKIGQINASFCLFPSAIELGKLEFEPIARNNPTT